MNKAHLLINKIPDNADINNVEEVVKALGLPEPILFYKFLYRNQFYQIDNGEQFGGYSIKYIDQNSYELRGISIVYKEEQKRIVNEKVVSEDILLKAIAAVNGNRLKD